MPAFKNFAQHVYQRLTEMSINELYTTADGDLIWEQYLAAFPEGTNPIYKTRTEHDCSCCKQFIRNFGGVVAIIDGKKHTIWSVIAQEEYQVVANALNTFVMAQAVTGLFRPTKGAYGAEVSKQLLEDGTIKSWNHFHGEVAKRHRSNTPDKARGDYLTAVQVFKRGLEELSPSAFNTATELITSNSLYRGKEHMAALVAFQTMQTSYTKLKSVAARNLFLWANAAAPVARFRNTVIGTLIQELSAGMDLEAAVRNFEKKVAPENYKRPTALVTPSMVKEAMKTIEALGLEPALDRRFAQISDVSVNNVLWVDNTVQSQMKGGIESLLMASAVKIVKDTKAESITIDEFMTQIAPLAVSMELLVKNTQANNFMSLTAPAQADTQKLFKWNNDFAWSYDGNITDSLKQKVASLGGRVDGVLRFSHTWNYAARNASLMDLHVFLPGSSKHPDGMHDNYPSGQRVGWNRREDYLSRGKQDVDYVNPAPEGYVPVENITFPDNKALFDGEYTFKIHNWEFREPTKGGFQAEIEFGGQLFQYDHPAPLKNKEWITLAVATRKDGVFSIDHKHPVGSVSQDRWGIKTETFVKVQTLMNSPNHWDGNAVGNKHWFFILEGCKNPLPARGIYNEFLNSNLEQHRKVFELLGDKTKCPPTDEQLSGLGFSSTRGDTVTVKVTGTKLQRTFNINF